MDHRFLAETIALRPMLFRAMLEFNRGSSCAVPEALAPFGNKAALLWKTPSFRRAWPVRRKQDEGYWNFSEESQRLALMDAHTLGRLGLFLTVSANLGHIGSVHKWTLEIVSAKPFKLYPFMKIGQISFWCNFGEPNLYIDGYSKYSHPHLSKFEGKYDINRK